MIKFAKFFSVFFHPLFLTFYNFLYFIFLTDAKGAALGFVITLFFLACVMIPIFYTVMIVYKENRDVEWEQFSDMSMLSRKKLLAYTIIYNVIFLLFVISLSHPFLGDYKPMFASVLMAFVFSMMLSFVLHLLNIKNSLHALNASFFLVYCLIFSWKIPGIESLENTKETLFLIFAGVNFIALIGVIWARLFTKAHTVKEIGYGLLVGILSPVILTLLTYGI